MKKALFTSVVLSAVAVGLVSYVNAAAPAQEWTWFDADIGNYLSWPSDGTDMEVIKDDATQGTWSGTANATYDTDYSTLVVNAGTDKLTFAAESSVDAATTNAEFVAKMTFANVTVGAAELPDPGSDIKAGLAVAMDEDALVYCGRVKDPVGNTNIWDVLTGATPELDVETTVHVLIKTENGALFAQYKVEGDVDDVVLTHNGDSWFEIATADNTLRGAKFAGSGYSLSALAANADAVVYVEFKLDDLPDNVTLVSVAANGATIEAEAGVYSVLAGTEVTVTFAAAAGYRLVGDSSHSLTIDEDTMMPTSYMPTAEQIPVCSLTLPELPTGVTLVSVTTNGVAIVPVEGAYPIYDGDTAVVTFAAAEGYMLSGSGTVEVIMNGNTTLDISSVPTAATLASFIKINEIMASNPSVDKGGITNKMGIAEMDWLEFYNAASVDIDITGWYLSDSVKKPMKAQINGSCIIPAKGYKIVWVDKIHTNATDYAADEAYVALGLSSSGDLIQLADSTGTVVAGQSIDFKTKPQIKGYSYGPVSVQDGEQLVPGNGPYVYMKTATPGAANVTEGWGDFTPAVAFSEPHGYKTEPFELTLSCADPEAAIYYTLDGTSPTTASILYTNAIPISMTTCVRAAVPNATSILQFDTSATYIFLDDVLAQEQSQTAPATAVGFPNSGFKSHKMLYGMRQEIVNGDDRERLLRGFTNSIATISLVIDPANLFDSTDGIYVNPAGRGEEWERQTMLEQINPLDANDGFSIPAGLRIRGSNSRNGNHAKHALRLFFRSSYGVSSLEHKIFPGEPDKEAGEYDKLDLRCSQNFSWANEGNSADTFIHEVFSRDSQRDMGQFHTRSRYYNLFINGQYWGLYQTQERGDEHFAESYAGGDSLDWDVIKTTTIGDEKYVLEADEGTLDAWSNLWETVVVNEAGLSADAIYQRVLGNNPDGTRNAAYPELLNPTNLMAYALITHYIVDGDGPVTPQSKHLNNMYALYDRTDGPTSVHGFFHLRHDAEMSFGKRGNVGYRADPTGWGSGDPTTTNSFNKYCDYWNTLEGFSPVKLHWELEKSAAYRRACADQFDKFFLRPGGAMTTEKNIGRFAKRMAEIDDAIVCEAARWGASQDRNKNYTRSTWLSACRDCTNGFLAVRMPYMLSQYRARGWYPSFDTPRVVNGNGEIYKEGGEVPYLAKVYISADAEGTTYYTLDGSDPMDAGANVYDGNGFAIPDEGATIRARTLKSGEWSALEEVTLESDVPNDQRYGIRIAEILNAAVNDPADEFIILTNTLDRAVQLEGLSIWSEKAGNALVKLAEIGEGVELAVGGTIKLTQPANWIGDTKLKNGEIYVELRDFNGKRIQNARVDSGTWFPTGEFNDKGKEIHACDKTGRWFVALEFLGDTDGGEVTQVTQWAVSPEPEPEPTIPLPENPTAKDEVLSVITNNADIEEWYIGISTNSAGGGVSITNFTGGAAAVELCYLLNNDILDESVTTNNAVELKIPSISFDPTTGNVIIDGELLIHNTEVSRTVNGNVRLYYANSLEALETSTDYLQISPPSFPVEDKDAGTTENIPARFYRLKIEAE